MPNSTLWWNSKRQIDRQTEREGEQGNCVIVASVYI